MSDAALRKIVDDFAHQTQEMGRRRRLEEQFKEQLAGVKRPGIIPPDPDRENDDRSKWAEAAVREFVLTTGADLCDAVSDLLADIMHWCDRHDIDFDHELERAKGHYHDETYQR
jgi:hypothetical protein